jgi:hypothetical protein
VRTYVLALMVCSKINKSGKEVSPMAKSKLTKEEKETILLTSEADDTWSIYTFNAALKKRLRKYAEKHPDLCRLKSEDEELGSATFIVSRSRVSIRFLPPVSEASRTAARENARRNGLTP